MRRPYLMLFFTVILSTTLFSGFALAQMHGGRHMGPGMGYERWGDQCPWCGHDWNGQYQSRDMVPDTLPKPQNQKWLNKLDEVLSLEKSSQALYEKDSRKFNLRHPYLMVIPQEINHIEWIQEMFAAYGVQPDAPRPAVTAFASPEDAYRKAMDMEADLIPKYEWLISNASDKMSGEILDYILLQTEMHYTMFSHGSGMGYGMGPGGRGRMHR